MTRKFFSPVFWVIEICRFLTSIRRWFFSISLNLHATSDSSICFSSRKISDVDESIVECRHKMDNCKCVAIFVGTCLWWTEICNLFFLNLNFFFRWLYIFMKIIRYFLRYYKVCFLKPTICFFRLYLSILIIFYIYLLLIKKI